MTRAIDTDARDEDEERWIDSESEAGAWEEDEESELPPRPRGRLLRPLSLALIAIVLAAAGFLGGVLAQKGSEGGTGAGGLPSFAAKGGGAGLPGGEGDSAAVGAGALPSFGGGSNAAASGTVTSVEGQTIYVKESDGTVVAVKVGDGATVTRDSNVAAKKVHPGDTVTVEGSKHGSTVKASSVSATESGVESRSGFGAPPSGVGGNEGGSTGEASVESLFEE